MFKIIKKSKRKSTELPFFQVVDASYKLYFKETFIDTKKFIKVEATLSADGLTMTTVSTWATRADFLECITDHIVSTTVIIPTRVYDIENDIENDVTTEE